MDRYWDRQDNQEEEPSLDISLTVTQASSLYLIANIYEEAFPGIMSTMGIALEEATPEQEKAIKEQIELHGQILKDAKWFKKEATQMLIEFDQPIVKPKIYDQKPKGDSDNQ